MLAPRGLVSACERIWEAWLSGAPTVTQAIVADFMDEGLFATHIRTMRQLYKTRHDALIDAAASLRGRIDLQSTGSGFHAVGFLSDDLTEAGIVSKLRAENVVISSLGRYALSPLPQQGVVLGFGSVTPEEIRKGIAVVRKIVSPQGKLD